MVNRQLNSFGFRRIAQVFLYLFVVFVPLQIGFMVSSTGLYFSGEFVPFLSHFLYLSDVFFLFSLLFIGLYWFFDKKYKFPNLVQKFCDDRLFLLSFLFLVSVFVSMFFSEDLVNSMVFSLRFLEFFIFSSLIFVKFVSFRRLACVFIAGMSLIALIGVFQFVLHHSLGLRFLGEPVLSSSLLGVAKVQLFGEKVLRAYGTFVHPNVFAAYLEFAIIFILFLWKDSSRKLKHFFVSALILLIAAFLLTFSRSAFLALGVVFMFYIFQKKTSFVFKSLLILLTGSFLFITFFGHSDIAVVERLALMDISKNIFLSKPWGVGIGNFTSVMSTYSSVKLLPWNYQPVHNIFLLLLNEVGLQGLIIFILLLGNVFMRFFRQKNLMILALFFIVVIIGLFDHYFISLYQGQFLFWFFIGLSGLFLSTSADKNLNNVE